MQITDQDQQLENRNQIDQSTDRLLDIFCQGKGWDQISQALNDLARLKGRNGRALPALNRTGGVE